MEKFASVFIKLTREEYDALVKLAEQKRRDPRAQAAVMIRRSLEEYGLIPWRPDSRMPIDDTPAESHGP